MKILREKLERNALKKRNRNKKNYEKVTRAESISIVIGALDDAISRRAIAISSAPINIVRRSMQEGILLYQQKIWQNIVDGKDNESIDNDNNNNDDNVKPNILSSENWVTEEKEEHEKNELQKTLSLWTNALETGRESINSELLDRIETMSETSLGSYGYGLADEEVSMLKVAEFELLQMNMGTMHHFGLFENDLEEEFEEIEYQIWNELMEDEEYRCLDEEQRPTPHDVLSGMLNEEAVNSALEISEYAATAIQAVTRGFMAREKHFENEAEHFAEKMMSELMTYMEEGETKK